jgi:hypothetical protein
MCHDPGVQSSPPFWVALEIPRQSEGQKPGRRANDRLRPWSCFGGGVSLSHVSLQSKAKQFIRPRGAKLWWGVVDRDVESDWLSILGG